MCVSRARARRTSTLRVNHPSSERFTGSSRNSLCAQRAVFGERTAGVEGFEGWSRSGLVICARGVLALGCR